MLNNTYSKHTRSKTVIIMSTIVIGWSIVWCHNLSSCFLLKTSHFPRVTTLSCDKMYFNQYTHVSDNERLAVRNVTVSDGLKNGLRCIFRNFWCLWLTTLLPIFFLNGERLQFRYFYTRITNTPKTHQNLDFYSNKPRMCSHWDCLFTSDVVHIFM